MICQSESGTGLLFIIVRLKMVSIFPYTLRPYLRRNQMATIPDPNVLEGEIDFQIPTAGKHCKTWYRLMGDLHAGKRPLIALHGGPGATSDYLFVFANIYSRSWHSCHSLRPSRFRSFNPPPREDGRRIVLDHPALPRSTRQSPRPF